MHRKPFHFWNRTLRGYSDLDSKKKKKRVGFRPARRVNAEASCLSVRCGPHPSADSTESTPAKRPRRQATDRRAKPWSRPTLLDPAERRINETARPQPSSKQSKFHRREPRSVSSLLTVRGCTECSCVRNGRFIIVGDIQQR